MGGKGSKTKKTQSSGEAVTNPAANTNPPPNLNKPQNIVLVGDVGVGKTSLMLQLVHNEFYESDDEIRNRATIGADFLSHLVSIGGKDVKLNIWDTGGQERYSTMTQSYYRNCNLICIIFDVTSKESFDNVAKWFTEVGRYAKSHVAKVVIANKTDMPPVVDVQIARKQAEALGAQLIETSAKTGTGVKEAFTSWLQ